MSGGLGIRNPADSSVAQHKASLQVSEPIVQMVLEQHTFGSNGYDRLQAALANQRAAVTVVKQLKAEEDKQSRLTVLSQLDMALRSAVTHATEDGASSWLSVRPIQDHGFALHKGASVMPLLSGMDGSQQTCRSTVPAASRLTAAMLSPAARVDSPSPATMKSGTSPPPSYPKSALMSRWSPICSRLLAKDCCIVRRTETLELVWT